MQGRGVSFLRQYVFSTDHKVIALQYAITGLVFLLIGWFLVALMRWQLAYPDNAVPIFGRLLQAMAGPELAPKGAIGPDLYNSFTGMHGTIMVFLAVVPIGFAAFGNFLLPLQIGAPDMAFPRLNMVSYQCYFAGGVVMLTSFIIPGGAARSGWTSYSPLATLADPEHLIDGQVFWLIGMIFLITSSLLGAINFISTIIQLRAPGMNLMRMPFFVWAQLVTAFLLLLGFPPLEAAAVLQLMDKIAGTSFFLPSGLIVAGAAPPVSGGGNPLLWQHLFWFLAHPEVYVLILPALGIVCEVLANNTRKPIFGYKALVYSALAMGVLSLVVWGHHMFLTGMGTKISTIFQTTTMAVSIPSVIIISCFLVSLWGGSIRFNTPMLFALGFLPMFGIGGLAGLPLGFNFSGLHLHDSFYVIAHFHYIVAPGTMFALFAGIYHWFPKVTGRMMNEYWGKVHFVLSLVFMNLVFMPMFMQGFAGLNRRLADGGAVYQGTEQVVGLPAFIIRWNEPIFFATWGLGLAQIPFIINLFWSARRGKKAVTDNAWEATTLEWQTASPPAHGNFSQPVTVYCGPYEYSAPNHPKGFRAQNEPQAIVGDGV